MLTTTICEPQYRHQYFGLPLDIHLFTINNTQWYSDLCFEIDGPCLRWCLGSKYIVSLFRSLAAIEYRSLTVLIRVQVKFTGETNWFKLFLLKARQNCKTCDAFIWIQWNKNAKVIQLWCQLHMLHGCVWTTLPCLHLNSRQGNVVHTQLYSICNEHRSRITLTLLFNLLQSQAAG